MVLQATYVSRPCAPRITQPQQMLDIVRKQGCKELPKLQILTMINIDIEYAVHTCTACGSLMLLTLYILQHLPSAELSGHKWAGITCILARQLPSMSMCKIIQTRHLTPPVLPLRQHESAQWLKGLLKLAPNLMALQLRLPRSPDLPAMPHLRHLILRLDDACRSADTSGVSTCHQIPPVRL